MTEEFYKELISDKRLKDDVTFVEVPLQLVQMMPENTVSFMTGHNFDSGEGKQTFYSQELRGNSHLVNADRNGDADVVHMEIDTNETECDDTTEEDESRQYVELCFTHGMASFILD